MTRLIVAVLVAALAWMGFWVFAQTSLTRAIRDYIEGPQAGVEVAASDVSVAGFPNRLDTTLTDVTVTLPETGTRWTAPVFELFSLVYRPTEVIAAFPPEHRLETPLQSIDVSHTRARASVALRATDNLALDRATLVIENGVAASSLGWAISLDEVRASVAEVEEADYRLGLEGANITFDAMPDQLADNLGRVRLDARASFTEAWDRSSMNAARLPQITDISVDDITVDWGAMSFLASGSVTVDGSGTPEGALELQIIGWQEAIDALTDLGIIPGDVAPALRFALGALADGDRLTVPLGFRRGLMTLGPLPIGPAPNLTIR